MAECELAADQLEFPDSAQPPVVNIGYSGSVTSKVSIPVQERVSVMYPDYLNIGEQEIGPFDPGQLFCLRLGAMVHWHQRH